MSEPRVSARQRRTIHERAGGDCEYCRSPARFSSTPFPIDHIEPRARGGRTTLDNLALSCPSCNEHKHTKTEAFDAASRMVVPLYHPRRQRWSDHFRWSDDYLVIIGLTPTGRATVEALHLNNQPAINLRRALCMAGEYPPVESSEDA